MSIAGIEDLGGGAPGHRDDTSAHGRRAAHGAGGKLDREAELGANPLLERADVGDGDAERRRFRVRVPAMLGDGIREEGRLAQPAAGEMDEQDDHGDHAQRAADDGGKECAAPPRRAPAQCRCRLACDVLLDPGPEDIRRLRTHTRYRRKVVQVRTAEKERCEKLLEDAHLKLSSVASDIHGMSGRAMLRAIIAGERRPRVLAEMALGRMRPKIARLEEALDCSFFTPEHAFILEMMLDSIDQLTAQIAVLDERIAVLCEPYERQIQQLDGIPGFGVTAARDLIAEIGADMSAFATAGHLASWARVAPRARESGKRKGKTATGRGNPYIGATLGETAASAGRTQTFLGAKLRRLCRHMPKKKAQGAIMRTQLVIAHALLSDPQAEYQDLGPGYYEQRADTRRQARSHIRAIERLGYKVTIEPLAPEADPETGELITRTAS